MDPFYVLYTLKLSFKGVLKINLNYFIKNYKNYDFKGLYTLT